MLRAHTAAAQERDRAVELHARAQLVEEMRVHLLVRIVVPLDVHAAGHVADQVAFGERARIDEHQFSAGKQRPRFGRREKPAERDAFLRGPRLGARSDRGNVGGGFRRHGE